MDAVLIAARLILAGVFAFAALAKLRDPAGTREALAAFRVPARLRHPLSLALPVVELAVAVLLVPTGTARAAALAAAVLLVAFTVGLISVLARGEEVECNCLGSISRRPVGRLAVARNVALLALAGLVALASSAPPAVAWIGGLSSAEAVGVVVALALALACALNFAFAWQLMKQNGRLRAELAGLQAEPPQSAGEAPAPGDPLPAFELPALTGGRLSLAQLLAQGRGATILFSDPGCSACDPLLPAIGRIQRDESVGPVVMIVNGDPEAAGAKAAEHGIDPVLLAEDFDLARSYGVPGIPALVRVGADGRLAERAIGAAESGELLAGIEGVPDLGEVLAGRRG